MALEDNVCNSDELLWSERPRRLEHRFLVLRKLGQGTYGKVQLALNKETNQEVAIKTIKKAKIGNDEDMLRIRREIHIMTSIRHPHIIHIYEVFETKQKIVIVMQYASGGELYDYLGCHQKLPEDEARRIFRQIASAIYYCHQNQICHRDLKLENILLDEDGNAQIADFGLSNIFDEKRRMTTFCGSPLYASPEIVKGTPYKGPEVDCWSLGVLLYTLIYGTMPFDGRNFKELVSQISEGRYEEPIIKSNASSLIRRLLTPDILRRATISDVCRDPWVNHNHEVSLLDVAGQMCSISDLKRERLMVTKLCLGTNSKNGSEKSIFRTPSQIEQETTKNSQRFANHFEIFTNSHKNQKLSKPVFPEQIVNYDVRFVINKLMAAVEALISDSSLVKNEETPVGALKDKTIASHSLRRKNGENNFTEKINSAYVIPIFEVTSTVPNIKELSKRNNDRRMQLQNGGVHQPIQNGTNNEKITSVMEKNDLRLKLQTNSSAASVKSTAAKELQHKDSFQDINGITGLSQDESKSIILSADDNAKIPKRNHDTDCAQPSAHTNAISRNKSSPKAKRLQENCLLGQKHSVPFVRTKNHVLTLARILSSNYERLVLNSFKTAENKKKPPGKVVIPANFDPNVPRDPFAIERERIVLFPTVSVSENKEKIERKIEKIKKAALNMNLIRHCDPKKRLKIENYLKSQAKKIQDLVCDEQRNLQINLKKIKLHASFTSFSEICRCSFANTINACSTEHQSQSQFSSNGPVSTNQSSEYFSAHQNTSESNRHSLIKSENVSHSFFNKFKKCDQCCTKKAWNEQSVPGTLIKSKSEIKLSSDYLKHVSFDKNKSHLKELFLDAKLHSVINKKNLESTNSDLVSGPSMLLSRSASDSFLLQVEKYLFERNSTDRWHDQNCKEDTIRDSQTNLIENCIKAHKNSHDKDLVYVKNNQSFENPPCSPGANKPKPYERKHSSYEISNLKQEVFICRSSSTKSIVTSVKEKINNDVKCYINRLASEPFLAKEKNVDTTFWPTIETKVDAIDVSIPKNDSKDHRLQKEKKILKRRNTLTCVIPSENEKNEASKNTQERNADVETYLWNIYKEQELLLLKQKSAGQFTSSPNLNHLPQVRRINDSKSMINLNTEGSVIEKYSIRDFERQLSSSAQTFDEIHPTAAGKALNFSKYRSQSERFCRGINQTKSISDEALTEEQKNDIMRKLFTEGKLSDSSFQPNPFFSQILNDMEKHEDFRDAKDNSTLRKYPRKKINFERRKKIDCNKSFLQLLSLKRIEEAEKEMDRTLKNETDESQDSLLEALKTYGYKSVISQRFQGSENDFESVHNSRYPHWFSARNLKADIPNFNYMYYDASFPSSTINSGEYSDFYDANNVFSHGTHHESQCAFNTETTPNLYETLYGFDGASSPNLSEIHYGANGGTSPNSYDIQYKGTPNPYENLHTFNEETTRALKDSYYSLNGELPPNMNHDFQQKSKKQSFYDWLSANFDEYHSTAKADRESLFSTDQNISKNETGISYSQWGTEKTSSFEDDSLTEVSNSSKNNPSSISNIGKAMPRKFSSAYVDSRKTSRPEKFRFQLAAGSEDEEKEESVHDRIWRKSFYSRFNNSALSRKERLNFADSDFSSESRAELANITSKQKGFQRNGLVAADDPAKNHTWKRNLSGAKVYGSSFDKLSSTNSVKSKFSKSLCKENSDSKSSSIPAGKHFSTFKNEDSDPEH